MEETKKINEFRDDFSKDPAANVIEEYLADDISEDSF